MLQERLGATTYQVSTPDHKWSNHILQINLIKEWVSRTADDAMGLLIRNVKEVEMDTIICPHYLGFESSFSRPTTSGESND